MKNQTMKNKPPKANTLFRVQSQANLMVALYATIVGAAIRAHGAAARGDVQGAKQAADEAGHASAEASSLLCRMETGIEFAKSEEGDNDEIREAERIRLDMFRDNIDACEDQHQSAETAYALALSADEEALAAEVKRVTKEFDNTVIHSKFVADRISDAMAHAAAMNRNRMQVRKEALTNELLRITGKQRGHGHPDAWEDHPEFGEECRNTKYFPGRK